jgi:hypothetical protein
VVRNIRVRIGSELATKLLRKWATDERALSLRIVISGGKLNILFTGGRLTEVGEDTGIFYYSTPGVHNMVCPEDFKRREREETVTFERMILSDSNWSNIVQIIRSKDDKPVPIESLSKWIN